MALIGIIISTTIIIALAIGLYLLPSYIAHKRNHLYKTTILVINIFFGVTVIGWVLCLAWAVGPQVGQPDPEDNKDGFSSLKLSRTTTIGLVLALVACLLMTML